ncbi:hypothetical protein BGZ76_003553 [Entomortierella beljakovae]|nr:hypothetical protein BGZ76_003553 [Entomortierella beljakovae]
MATSTTTTTTTAPCKLALVQLAVTADKNSNLANARIHVLEAASNGANLIVLPECFNSPYGTNFFPEYAESIKEGPSVKALSAMAKVGVGICYDIRFPEPAMIAARQGCFAMIYPGAFNMTTGPLHWELLQRARAVDNQMYVAACSPARDVTASYHAWGHSTIVGPSGDVIQTTDEKQSIIYADLDLTKMNEFRQNIPLSNQRRFDLYSDVSKVKP